jgi:nucleotide-binding universal stress UspA family protein
MKAFGKILVPIDLDLTPGPIIEMAGMVAHAFGAKVTLVHVFETEGYHGPEVLDPNAARTPGLEQELKHWRTARAMMDLLEALGRRGTPAVGRMAFGTTEETVTRLAAKEGFDLIVLGSRGRDGLARFLEPSVAAAIVRIAPCPVLVIPHVQEKWQPKP